MRILGITLQLVLFSMLCLAQEQPGNLTDSSRTNRPVVAEPNFGLSRPILLFSPLFQPETRFESMLLTDPHFGIRQPGLQWLSNPKADLLSPYLIHRQQESNLSVFYSILGAAELGGAAYLAYRHLKK